jgi:tetratricopeptide (TPR) repeat protein
VKSRPWIAFVVLSCLLLLQGSGVAQQVDKEKLRAVIKMPTVWFITGCSSHSVEGILLAGHKSKRKELIAQLRREMEGNAGDAERYYKLGVLYSREGQKNASKECYARAAELFRQRVRDNPQDGYVLSQLALAIVDAIRGKDDPLPMARKAVELSPRNARCWSALGTILDREISRILHFKGGEWVTGFMERSPKLLRFEKKPSSEEVERARKLRAEAMACFDKAVDLAPKEPSGYYVRLAYRLNSAVLLASAAESKEELAAAARYSPRDARELQKAAELRPTDHRALFMASGTIFAAGHAQTQLRPAGGADFMDWAEKTLRENLGKLAAFTTSEDLRVASESAEVLAYTLVSIGKFEPAQAILEKAVQRDPDADRNWEGLAGVLAVQKKFDEGIVISRQWLKHKETAFNHFSMAKSLWAIDQFSEAEKEVRTGLKLEPEHILCHLGLAAVLLRNGGPDRLAEAARHLDQADKRLRVAVYDKYDKQETTSHAQMKIDYHLLRAVQLGLQGDAAGARRLCREVLAENPGHEQARKVLEAVGKAEGEKKRMKDEG